MKTTAEVVAGYSGRGEIDYSTPIQANQVRAGWGAEALKVFANRTGVANDDLETAGADLIACLLHLLWMNDADIEDVMFRAIGYFETEQKEI